MVTDRLLAVLPRTADQDADGRLTVGGCALADVAAEFGTPAFVVDEQGLRDTAREYLDAFKSRHPDTDVHFASKALPCAPVTRILAEEGLGCDVASAGELAIALAAGFDPAHILLHGNAKSDQDIGDALDAGVGMIVIDGPDDVDRLERLGRHRASASCCAINPSVPGQTHAAMDTGSPEAKFGVALEDARRRCSTASPPPPGLELRGPARAHRLAAARPRRLRPRGAGDRRARELPHVRPRRRARDRLHARTSARRRSPTTPRRPSARCTSTSTRART